MRHLKKFNEGLGAATAPAQDIMKTIVFTDHPDSGKTFIIQTDCPKSVLENNNGCYSVDEFIDYIISKGYKATAPDIKVTHVYDMPNAMLDIVWF